MKPTHILTLIASLLLLGLITPAQAELPKNQNLLFVQTAPSAIIEKDPGDKDLYILTLMAVNPKMTYFAQPPARQSGLLSVTEFCKDWRKGHDSFEKDHPNADLVMATDETNKRPVNVPVILMSMHHNSQKQTVTYTFKKLHDAKHPEKKLAITQYGYTALFIDDWCMSCY